MMGGRSYCPEDDCQYVVHSTFGKHYNYCPLCGAELEDA